MANEEKKSGFRMVIPISSEDELTNYRKGIMALLRKVEIDDCDSELIENLKSVYDLLSRFRVEGTAQIATNTKNRNRKSSPQQSQ
jgi:hypothetical protein